MAGRRRRGGSRRNKLFAGGSEGGKFVTRPPRPALIVVLVVQAGEHLVYTTGQSDFSGTTKPDAETPECQERLRGMMEDLRIARSLRVS